MTRAHYVKKAQKDNPAVKKGEPYYWWKFRYGGKRYSATPPTRSQLTQSEFYARQWDIEDRVNDFEADSIDDIRSFAEEIAGDIRELGEEQREKFDNLPENFQSGSAGELLEERADACEMWADEFENLDIEDFDEDAVRDDLKTEHEGEEDFDLDDAVEEAREEARITALDALKEIEYPG